jgi:hypothetical protein
MPTCLFLSVYKDPIRINQLSAYVACGGMVPLCVLQILLIEKSQNCSKFIKLEDKMSTIWNHKNFINF